MVVVTVKVVATLMLPEVPLMAAFELSVAVMVWLPLVFSVAENVPTPRVNVELMGRIAWASVVLVK